MDWTNNDFDKDDTSVLTEDDRSVVGFLYSQMMVDGSNLRSTENLETLYKNKSRYVDKNWGLQDFQWNYEYDILPIS